MSAPSIGAIVRIAAGVRSKRAAGRGMPHSAELLALKFFEDVILADLCVLQKFEAAQHRRRGNVVGKQPRQDFVGAPFLQLRGSDLAPFDCVDRSIACGLEAGIVDEVLAD